MAHCINQQLAPLEGRVPIKNLHTVRGLQVYNNKEIFVIYDSLIHIHSIAKIISSLPSLVYVIELQPIVSKTESENYQDNLTRRILSSNKSSFGQIIFSQELNPDKNVLVSVTHLRDRLRFLSSQFVKIKNVHIHQYGHLLINFQDHRCILIKRANPVSVNQRYRNLYKIEEPMLLNNILKCPIIQALFVSNQQTSLICLHKSDKQSTTYTLSRISMGDKNAVTVLGISSKKPSLQQKGLMGMEHIRIKNQHEWIILIYYNRLQVIQVGKANHKNKNYPILSHKQADFSEELSGEHIMRFWKYQIFNKDDHKMGKFFLLTSSSLWELDINFKQEPVHHFAWNYTITKLEDQPVYTKSNVFFVNHQGHYLQSTLDKQGHPNFILNLAVETDNGIFVRLQASNANYKQGSLYIACPSAVHIVEKMMRSMKQKINGDKCWVNFDDLNCLQNNPNLRKQILKQMTQINKQNKKQENTDEEQSKIVNKLIINVLTLFKSKPDIVQNLINKSISGQLKITSRESYNPNFCMLTNKRITVEDVLVCDRCHLYCIKSSSLAASCYICWNPLYQIS